MEKQKQEMNEGSTEDIYTEKDYYKLKDLLLEIYEKYKATFIFYSPCIGPVTMLYDAHGKFKIQQLFEAEKIVDELEVKDLAMKEYYDKVKNTTSTDNKSKGETNYVN